MNTCAVVIAANAGTLPAEGHGMNGAPNQHSDFLLHIGKRAVPNNVRNIGRNHRRNCFVISNIWPRLLGDETLDATVSNISSTSL